MRTAFAPRRHDGAHAKPRLRRLAEVPGQHLPATSRKKQEDRDPLQGPFRPGSARLVGLCGETKPSNITGCTVSGEDTQAQKCTASTNTAPSDAACYCHLQSLEVVVGRFESAQLSNFKASSCLHLCYAFPCMSRRTPTGTKPHGLLISPNVSFHRHELRVQSVDDAALHSGCDSLYEAVHCPPPLRGGKDTAPSPQNHKASCPRQAAENT